MQILEPLRIGAIARLWTGLALSAIGDQLQRMAIVWLSLQMLGSRAGFVTAAESAVAIAVALFAGGLTDRWDHRRTMLGADLARAIVALLPVVAAAAGCLGPWTLVPSALGLAALRVVFEPALHASLPRLAPERDLLVSTNALMDATSRLARLVGPSLAGLLAAALPIVGLMGVDALSFVASAGAVASLRRALPVAAHAQPRSRRELLLAGVRAVRRRPVFVYLLWLGGVASGLWVLAMWLCLPLVVQRQRVAGFGLDGLGVLGLVMGCYGIGNVAGNLLVSALRVRRPVAMILVGNAIVGLGLLAMGVICATATGRHLAPLLMLAAAATAVGGPLSDVPMATLRQTEFQPHEVAAVYRLAMVADWGGVFVATALGPLLLAGHAPAPVMQLCATGILVAVLIGYLARSAARPRQSPARCPQPAR